MKITRLTVSNFRCFGPEPTEIDLASLTTFVGSNACGKTAVLAALARLFGVTSGDRGIRKSDFHLPPDTDLPAISELALFIEVRIDFPELQATDGAGDAVPGCFKHMRVDAPGELPHCRVRLDAKWTKTTLPEGEVEETISWVDTSEKEVKDEHKTRMSGDERSRIQCCTFQRRGTHSDSSGRPPARSSTVFLAQSAGLPTYGTRSRRPQRNRTTRSGPRQASR